MCCNSTDFKAFPETFKYHYFNLGDKPGSNIIPELDKAIKVMRGNDIVLYSENKINNGVIFVVLGECQNKSGLEFKKIYNRLREVINGNRYTLRRTKDPLIKEIYDHNYGISLFKER